MFRQVRSSEMWASVAISVIWLAVLFDAVFGPDFVSTSAGGNYTRIPSAIILAVFAYLATRVVARYGFGHEERPTSAAEKGAGPSARALPSDPAGSST